MIRRFYHSCILENYNLRGRDESTYKTLSHPIDPRLISKYFVTVIITPLRILVLGLPTGLVGLLAIGIVSPVTVSGNREYLDDTSQEQIILQVREWPGRFQLTESEPKKQRGSHRSGQKRMYSRNSALWNKTPKNVSHRFVNFIARMGLS